MTDVAIIGLACRFPAAADPRDFWCLIRDGLEVTQLPGNVAEFDADFFNLSPREASAMDPRQRLALELAWELLEDAFLVPETLRGEQVSIALQLPGKIGDRLEMKLLPISGCCRSVDHGLRPCCKGMALRRSYIVRGPAVGSFKGPQPLDKRTACRGHHLQFVSIVPIRGGQYAGLVKELAVEAQHRHHVAGFMRHLGQRRRGDPIEGERQQDDFA